MCSLKDTAPQQAFPTQSSIQQEWDELEAEIEAALESLTQTPDKAKNSNTENPASPIERKRSFKLPRSAKSRRNELMESNVLRDAIKQDEVEQSYDADREDEGDEDDIDEDERPLFEMAECKGCDDNDDMEWIEFKIEEDDGRDFGEI